MNSHKVLVRPIGNGGYYVQVDDKRMLARSVDLHMEVGDIPQIDIGLVGEPDMEIEGMIQFDYTPKTVIQAAKVIKTALMKNDITAFLAINSLNEAVEKIGKK